MNAELDSLTRTELGFYFIFLTECNPNLVSITMDGNLLSGTIPAGNTSLIICVFLIYDENNKIYNSYFSLFSK